MNQLQKTNSMFPVLFAVLLTLSTGNSNPYHYPNINGRTSSTWLNHGGDLQNRRYAADETKISPRTISNLRLKWKFNAERDITATPAIYNGTLYFPSWDGYVYAVNSHDGTLVWKKDLIKLTGMNTTMGQTTGVNTTVARATPTVGGEDGELLIIGIYGPSVIVAVRRETGERVWMTNLDEHYAALITMSGTYYKRGFYVGVASLEEGASIENCCIFRGSFVKLDIQTGTILWKTYMLPDNHGKRGQYAGAAVWGSSPSIDPKRNLVFIATGNLYSAPVRVQECQEKQNNETNPTEPDKCIEPDNLSNAILALDLDNGRIKWSHQLGGYDVWFFACSNISVSPDCPPGPNLDADFGEAPMLLSVVDVSGKKRELAVAVQKSGIAWALDRDSGKLFFATEAGPGGAGGGGTWGAATDGKRIYTNIANSGSKNFTLKPSNRTTTTGGWVAMDAKNGSVLWTTKNPSNASASGPVTVANGVVFAGSVDGKGPFYGMDARTGKVIWTYETGASVYGGASVKDGCVYVGNGYKVNLGKFVPGITAGKTLFAFCVC